MRPLHMQVGATSTQRACKATEAEGGSSGSEKVRGLACGKDLSEEFDCLVKHFRSKCSTSKFRQSARSFILWEMCLLHLPESSIREALAGSSCLSFPSSPALALGLFSVRWDYAQVLAQTCNQGEELPHPLLSQPRSHMRSHPAYYLPGSGQPDCPGTHATQHPQAEEEPCTSA